MQTLTTSKATYRQKLTLQILEDQLIPDIGTVRNSKDAALAAFLFWDLDNIKVIEQAYALYLNRASEPISWAEISSGASNSCLVDIKIVMSHALLSHASSFVLFHNHPSGKLTPSNADLKLTKTLQEMGKLMQIHLLDHVILSPDGNHYSIVDNGRLI